MQNVYTRGDSVPIKPFESHDTTIKFDQTQSLNISVNMLIEDETIRQDRFQ